MSTSNLLIKMQLVSTSGLSLATFPMEEDETKSQLAGGIMTALLAFSKEVHNRELESLSYQDGSVYFLPIHEYYLVLEIESDVDEEKIRNLVEGIRSSAHNLLGEYQNDISLNDADSVLDELHTISMNLARMNEFGHIAGTFILTNPTPFQFRMNQTGETYNVIASSDVIKFASPISQMILNGDLLLINNQNCRIGIIKVEEQNLAAFVIARVHPAHVAVAGLIVSEDSFDSLIALNAKLYPIARALINSNYNIDLETVLQKIIENASATRFSFNPSKSEFISFPTLERNVNEVEKALFCVVLSEKVVVSGERAIVKIVVNTLSLFGLHRTMDMVEWLPELPDSRIDLTGISRDYSDSMKNRGLLDDNITFIDIDKRKIRSPIRSKNKFLKKIFDDAKKLDAKSAAQMIKTILEECRDTAFDLSKFTLRSNKHQVLEALQTVKKETNDDAKYELTQVMATILNPWLFDILNDQSIDSDWI
ncbi:MAG: hypothetical protein IH840_10390 [Candidatus Heimdallarchaeota archaeon]|nr:hypothetical protein [Candidatus Heimdallarchaeota archaeon]